MPDVAGTPMRWLAQLPPVAAEAVPCCDWLLRDWPIQTPSDSDCWLPRSSPVQSSVEVTADTIDNQRQDSR